MSLLTQACLLEQCGPHLNLDQVTALLDMKKNPIYNKVTVGIDAARGWMSNAELANAIHAALILVPRTVPSPPVFITSCRHFEALLAGQLRGAQEGAAAARGQE